MDKLNFVRDFIVFNSNPLFVFLPKELNAEWEGFTFQLAKVTGAHLCGTHWNLVYITSNLDNNEGGGGQFNLHCADYKAKRRFLYWVGAGFPGAGAEQTQKYNFIPFADRFYLHQGKFSGDLVTFPQIYNNCFVLYLLQGVAGPNTFTVWIMCARVCRKQERSWLFMRHFSLIYIFLRRGVSKCR